MTFFFQTNTIGVILKNVLALKLYNDSEYFTLENVYTTVII